MKRRFAFFLLLTGLIACKKSQTINPPGPKNAISGKWTITSVTVIPLDSTGKAINNGTVYPEPNYYYFQFNTNNTWTEVLAPDPNSDIGESGTYTLHSDTAFTMINTKLPANPVDCKIVSLSDTVMVFSHQHTTLFNGVTPGFLQYVFDLKKRDQ
jgi:hypothetical protein